MNAIIVELVRYVNRESVGPALESLESLFGREATRALSGKIVVWICTDAALGRRRPLKLERHFAWCGAVEHLARNDAGFREVFCVGGQLLDFNSSLATQAICEIQDYCTKYNKLSIHE